MKLKNLFLLVILFLFFDNNMQASGHMVGKEFIFENSEMQQVLSFKNNTISIQSVFDKKTRKELIAENALPYFEFQINEKTVTSSMPVWKFIKYTERSMVNQGLEYVFYFEGKGSYKGLKIELYRQYFRNSTLTREKIQLKSTQGANFQLNKRGGKLHFIYPRLSLNNNMEGSIQEIQIANFQQWNHTFYPSVRNHTLTDNDELFLKGPFSVTCTGNHKVMSTYEHASQDEAKSFRLSAVTSMKKGDIDASQGVEGDETEIKDENFWFIAHHYNQIGNTRTIATELIRGGYFDNEKIPYDSYYETVWNSFSFIGKDEKIEPLIHNYLFSQITEHPKSRESHFYYNTWAMQRELNKKGHDLRGSLTEERILQEIDYAALMNIELFVLDDGWEEALGVWTPNQKRFPNKLTPFVNRMKDHNMIPGIWLSPMAIDSLFERYRQYPEWIIRRSDGVPIVAQWGRPVFDIVGPFSELFLEDCKKLIDQGIRFFKWDAMNTFNSSLSGLEHGDNSHTKKERIERYNYLFPFYVTRIMKELREYNKDVVIEVDLTEPERCMIGLMPLQEGIFFFVNNGASAYGDYSTFRTKSMRTVINNYGYLFPKELFTYAVYPHDVAPYRAQCYNINNTLIAGHGFWGDLSLLTPEERIGIGKTLAKAKRIRPYIHGTMIDYNANVGASPEIYTQVDSMHAFGQVVGFSGSKVRFHYKLALNRSQLLGILNYPYTSDHGSVSMDFHFNKPDDTVSAFFIGNKGEKISVISSTGRLDDIQLENNLLMIKVASASTVCVKYEEKKLIRVIGGSVLSQSTDEVTLRSKEGEDISIIFENIL
ncbi:alpha-galactosidase [Parabacteroides timonensis]|uniref:alpha-galactosidase n=1 Tax=Parabacteroides timonensis TaxID=1871013 RepID=UPI00094EA55D|nr:alpha-galactosidase [Parabacteroides timonensis]